MEITIVCVCGNKEILKSKEIMYNDTNLHAEKFNISGYEDGGAFIDCSNYHKRLNF